MTTPKQAAALALAEAWCSTICNDGSEEAYFASWRALSKCEAAYKALRHEPDAPDLTALEREYLEACYTSRAGSAMCAPDRMERAYAALHAAREAASESLVEARKLLAQYATSFDASTEQFDALSAITDRIDAALAQRKEQA